MKRLIALVFAMILALSVLPASADNITISEYIIEVDGLLELQNPQLKTWCSIFQMYQSNTLAERPDGDYAVFNGDILFEEGNQRSNADGIHIVDGGKMSEYGSYSVGMGASPEDENMWYVSFLYNQEAETQNIIDNTIDMLKATETIFGGFGETDDETTENLLLIAQALIASGEDIAVEAAGFVFATKYVGNQMLIMIDTLEFYNAFYKGSIANYYVL